MSKSSHQRQNQIKEGRLEIVSQLYKRGYSYRKIREEVMRRLDLSTYSISTVQKDIDTLLKEWRENRINDTNDLLELELARIDETVKELWEQWEKSKEDYTRSTRTQKGAPVRNEGNENGSQGQGEERLRTFSVERKTQNVVGLGNTAYIAEIRQQLAERRKLLGLYAPEKRDLTGSMSFAGFLMESGMLDAAEQETGQQTATDAK